MTYRHIIVGSDGSSTATNAVRAAARLAIAHDAVLHLVTAWSRDDPDGPSRRETSEELSGGTAARGEMAWASATVSDASGIGRVSGVGEVRQHTPPGNPAEVLLDVSESLRDSLIVVGTVGLDSATERLLGNIPHQLTHHARRDLFLVRRDHVEDGWGEVWLATDGSTTAGRACVAGHTLATALGATPVLVTVGSGDRAESALSSTASLLDGQVEQRALGDGRPAEILSELAHDADLLVMGNKGMSGASRLLGSVPNRVTHDVPTDVLLVNTTREKP